ncbi:MAG: hypothetical protein RIB98_07175 [Acidimicrobiales bacterium]
MWRSRSRPDRRAGASVLLVTFFVAMFAIGVGGCGDCQTDCGEPQDLTTFTGELLVVEDPIATFDGPEGRLEIRIEDNLKFLDVGESYRVTVYADDDRPDDPYALINPSCSCGGSIVHADGQRIDTSYWRSVKEEPALRLGLGLFVGVPALTLVLVTLGRVTRGLRSRALDE